MEDGPGKWYLNRCAYSGDVGPAFRFKPVHEEDGREGPGREERQVFSALLAQSSIFRLDRDFKDRKFYRVVESRRAENGRCFLVPGPNEQVSDGPGIL